MVFLPIVEREFRRAAQRRRTYWVRLLPAIVAALVGVVAITKVGAWTSAAGIGRSLFSVVAAVSFWVCLLVGIFTTSVCLSEEKRQGTFGLLFLTDLKGYDVVSGKLANVSLSANQALMGILPVLALSMVFGGVYGGLLFLQPVRAQLAAGVPNRRSRVP